MNKTAFLLAALLPALALADVSLYGNIRSGLTVSQTTVGGVRTTTSGIDDLGSYIGFRGSHPIGGSQLIWQFQQDVPVGSSDSLRERARQRKENRTDHGWAVGIGD